MSTPTFYGLDPFRQIRRLQSEVGRLGKRGSARRQEFPALNAYANQDGLIITAELPGVKMEDLTVSVHRDSITLSGERKTDVEEAKGYHRRERWLSQLMGRSTRSP